MPSYATRSALPAWGLHSGRKGLLATVRSRTVEGAIQHFEQLPPHLRDYRIPTVENVWRLDRWP